jgi:hypothetical protein
LAFAAIAFCFFTNKHEKKADEEVARFKRSVAVPSWMGINPVYDPAMARAAVSTEQLDVVSQHVTSERVMFESPGTAAPPFVLPWRSGIFYVVNVACQLIIVVE